MYQSICIPSMVQHWHENLSKMCRIFCLDIQAYLAIHCLVKDAY